MNKPSQLGASEEIRWPTYYQSNVLVFSLFLGFVVYWYLQGGYRFPVLGSMRFEFFSGVVLAVFGVRAYFSNPGRGRSGAGSWAGMLIILMASMVVFSYVPKISYDMFVDRVIKLASFGFFIAAFVTTPKRLALFIGAFLFACLKMGQEGVLGTITGSLMWENQGVMRLHGSTPMYEHPNSLSGMALGSLPFVLYFYQIAPWILRLGLLALFFSMLTIIIFTGSRTGYVGLVIGAVYFCWRSANRKRAFAILILLSCVSVPLLPHDYIERARTIFTQKEKEGASTEARKEILVDAWQIFLSNPLGVGVHAFPAVREARFGRAQDTHNLYFEVATNLGVQGVIVFGGFLFALLRALSRTTASVTSQMERVKQALANLPGANARAGSFQSHLQDLSIMRATCQAVYVFIIIRLSLGIFGMDLYEIYWWFALGVTVAVWNLNNVATTRTNILCSKCGDENVN